MPAPYPQEFRDDVVRVAQNREDGVTLEQIAADFGIHPMTLQKWIRKADVEAGIKPGTTSAESQELREAKRRVRLLEQENEALRRAAQRHARSHHARGRGRPVLPAPSAWLVHEAHPGTCEVLP